MGLSEDIRDRVGRGLLPAGIPPKINVSFGSGQFCSACNLPIVAAQGCYQFAFGAAGVFRFHLECLGLWTADLRRRGWLPPTPVEASGTG
jgi:hypothetical protein